MALMPNTKRGILSGADSDKVASLDILAVHAQCDGNKVTFHITTNGTAGADPAVAVGQMAGAPQLCVSGQLRLILPLSDLKAGPAFCHWRQPPTPIFMTPRCLTKM